LRAKTLLGQLRELEVYARVVVHLLGCGKVYLLQRNVVMVLVANKDCCARQGIVVNLLCGAAIFEDQGQGIPGINCGRCLWRDGRLFVHEWRRRDVLVG
jgi:hypothetical protein